MFIPYTEKPLDVPVDVVNKSPITGPSIMKKRGYEHSNGVDAGIQHLSLTLHTMCIQWGGCRY